MRKEVEEVVLFENVSHLGIVRFEEIASHQDLERVAVVNVDQEETNSNRSKKPTNVRKDLVDFLITTLNAARHRRFVEKESSIARSSRVDGVAILDAVLSDHSSLFGLSIRQRYDTLVSLNREVFHQKLTFFTSYC